MFIGVAMLAPIPFSLYYHSGDHFAFAGAAGGALLLGFLLRRLTHFEGELRHREAFVIVALTWIAFSCVGSLPYMITGAIPSFTNAFFETASGFTTTGASILTDIEALPRGVLLWRALTQWIGGMGIIVMSLAILPFLGVGGMQLYRAETPGPVKDTKLTPRITETAKALWYVYLAFTTLCAGAYLLAGMDLFDAICHAFSTVAIGGFSHYDASIGYFDSRAVELVAVFFMLLGAMNFGLHFVAWRSGHLGIYWRDPECQAFLRLMATLSFQRAISGGSLGEGAALAVSMVPFLLAAIMFSYFGLQRRAWQQGGGDK